MEERMEIIAGYYAGARAGLVEYVGRRTGNSSLAEDMVHDAFVRLMTTDKMLTVATLPALTYTIVRNLLADHFRRLAYNSEYVEHVCHAGTYTDNAGNLCSRHEIEECLERGIARLPEHCREVYRLHIFGGMKIAEIQQATGEDYKKLEHRLGQARKQMRLYMKRFA